MNKISLIFSSLIMCITTTAQSAEWEHYELKDEMRNEISHGATLMGYSISDPKVSLSMNVFNKSAQSQATVLTLVGDRGICSEQICEVSVRFDDGDIVKEFMSFSSDGKTIIPNRNSAFSASVGLSKVVFIEIPLSGRGLTQFKYDVNGPAFDRIFNPSLRILGVDVGGAGGRLPGYFTEKNSTKDVVCRAAEDVEGVVPNSKISSINMCFYRGMLYSVFMKAKSKKEVDSIAAMLGKYLGPVDKESYFPEWPKSTGKVIDDFTLKATYWPDQKIKNTGLYMIFDEGLAPLVPK